VVATAKGHVRYAVVSLDSAGFPGEPTAGQLRIENKKCAFAPHVQTGTVGSTLNAFNQDGVLHNVRLYLKMGSKRRSLLNLALPAKTGPVNASRATRRAGTIEVTCDAHTWMSAYVVLFDHPYHSVTDAQGSFAIENVPPGTYPLKVWHESLGELVTEVVVEAGKPTTLALQFN
jgi:plastocyanin